MRNKLHQNLKRIKGVVALMLTATIAVTAVPQSAYASSNIYNTETDSLLGDIAKLMPILEETLKQKKDIEVSKLKRLIKENHWDYEYTMQAYDNLGNPYKDVDYTQLIAAYATITEMGRNGNGLFTDIPFLEVKASEVYDEDEDVYYGTPSFEVMDADGVMEYYGYEKDSDAYLEYKARLELISQEINRETLTQTVFIKTPKSVASEETDTSAWLPIAEKTDGIRKDIIITAMSLMGQVPYQWGGKASKPGYDRTWWTFAGNEQKGLDCSGFVQWVYMTTGFSTEITKNLISTAQITSSLTQISKEDLKPGDIGILHPKGSNETNHTGIYIGDGYWIHCSSGKGTVVINKFPFKYFYSILVDNENNEGYNLVEYTIKNDFGVIEDTENTGIEPSEDAGYEEENDYSEEVESDTEIDEPEETLEENRDVEEEEEETEESEVTEKSEPQYIYSVQNSDIPESDILLLAQLITHEAGAEGYNGWVAVGEVVRNRVYSTAFPNSVAEVVFQSGQFSNIGGIRSIEPSSDILSVAAQILQGNLNMFGNPDVLFFRNPSYAGLSSTDEVNWGSYRWYKAVGKHAFYLI